MDWPISWQKVKDASGNTGGGSGSGLPMIDLTKYVLHEGSPGSAQITDAADIEVLETLLLEEKPIIAKIAQAYTNGGAIVNDIYCFLANYIRAAYLIGFVGTMGASIFLIRKQEGAWSIQVLAANG